MSFLATWKNHEQNRVFKLINKILLLQYTEGIFFWLLIIQITDIRTKRLE